MAEEFPAALCGGNWWNLHRAAFSRSSCSSVITDMGSFGGCWPSDLADMKAKSSDESSDGSMVFQDFQKPGGGGATTVSPDPAFPMMGVGLSNPSTPTTTDWINQSLLMAFSDGCSPAATAPAAGFSMEQQHPLNFTTTSSSDYPSSFLQTFSDTNSPPPSPPPPPPLPPFYDFQSNLNSFDFTPNFPSIRPKQQVHGGLHLANKTPFWNTSPSNFDDNISSFFPSSKTQSQSNFPNLIIKSKNEELGGLKSSAKKVSSGEPAFKRPRIETPSPLPSFKVRKEKLGDRITALQQLVSPFGKTDTASVLHEAIEYIKLLHDQVHVLSTPYMKNGATMQKQVHDKPKAMHMHDLRSLGLCLVPVSSTFPVTTESAPGFWTPSFGGTFR